MLDYASKRLLDKLLNKVWPADLGIKSPVNLHTLAEHCDFGAIHDQLIRDRMVVGIIDYKLSEPWKKQLLQYTKLKWYINNSPLSEMIPW